MSERGLALSEAIRDTEIDGNDMDALLQSLTAAFGVDYYNPYGFEHTRAAMVFDMARQRGWRKTEFRERLMAFISTQRFPTWVPADFFSGERVNVYPYSWYLARLQESTSNTDAIGTYRLPDHDKPVFGWRHEIGTKLEAFELAKTETRALPAPREPLKADTTTMIDAAKLGLYKSRITELENDLARLQSENIRLRHELFAATAEFIEAPAQSDELVETIVRPAGAQDYSPF